MSEAMYINAKVTDGEKPHPSAPDFQAYWKKKQEFSSNIMLETALVEQSKLDKGWVQFDAYLDFGEQTDANGRPVNELVRQIFQQYNGMVNIRLKPKYNAPNKD
tara:strand:- start:2096 stop:2407 length:312 start_codon:yes stop_codon:yes gene_type:complete